MMKKFLIAIAAAFGVGAFAMPGMALAEALPAPAGVVVLSVTGTISETNDGDAAQFDMKMLQALGARQIETGTIWTEGTNTFTGVPLEALMAQVGATGSLIRATALNDYSVEVPMSDAREGGPIIAYALDGQPMPRRDKGPLWLIYPFDDAPEFRTEVIYSRSIWQLDRIEVVD